MKLSTQLSLAKNHLAWTMSDEDLDTNRHRWSCVAVAEVVKGCYWKDPGAVWYFNWLLDNGAKRSCSDNEILAGLEHRCDEESQSVRFMLLCFAELDAKDRRL